MNRITKADLEGLAKRLNELTDSPPEPYTWNEAKNKSTVNIGNYHIHYGYGGAALERMKNKGGGVSDLFGGHLPRRELYDKLSAYIRGVERGCASFEATRKGSKK